MASRIVSIGRNIRKICHARDLTLKELEDMCGVTSVTIMNIELGKKKGCTFSTIFKIAEALNVSFDLLMK
jgi:transcriptional regulator with XRE-family HTH domain